MNRLVGLTFALISALIARGAPGQDPAAIEKARELLKQREYQQVIDTLGQCGTTYSAAYLFYEAHKALNARRAFIERCRPDADSGNPFVSSFVAYVLRFDTYLLEPRAIERYLLNAERAGDGLATKDLGELYFSGLEGNGPNPAPAVRANLDMAKKMFNSCKDASSVGVSCKIGLGHTLLAIGSSPASDAIALFEEAQADGILWGMYYFGIGVPADRTKADTYLARIKGGPRVSGDWCALDIREYADAMIRNEPAGLEGIAFSFAISKRRPVCLPGGPAHYLDLMERAAKAGSPVAVEVLADNYYLGEMTRKDPVLAYFYYSILSIVGNANQRREANDDLTYLEQRMSATDLSEARALFRKWRG